MTRQDRSMTDRNQVNADFETFFLPFEASLDLEGRTAYATTDPAVNLSMVNIRHLRASRVFRGEWVAAPVNVEDAMVAEPYVMGQVVIGSNNVVYRLTTGDGTADPTTDTTNWTAVGVQLSITDGVDTSTGVPGLVSTDTNGVISLAFRGYTGGNGISIDNATGEIRTINFALTDVHTFTTATDRNNEATVEWHTGDVAIVMEDTGAVGTGADRQGQGTYVYTGTNQGVGMPAATNNDDWTLLALPGNAVTSVVGVAGPTIETSDIVNAINDDAFIEGQILTEAEASRVASRYMDAGPPAANFAMGTRQTGDVYVDTTDDILYFFSGDAWEQASAATLGDIGDVYLTNPGLDHHLVYSPNAGGTGIAGWHNQTPTQISGRNIPLEDLQDVVISAVQTGHIIHWDQTARGGSGAWINITASAFLGSAQLDDIGDVIGYPETQRYYQFNAELSQPATVVGNEVTLMLSAAYRGNPINDARTQNVQFVPNADFVTFADGTALTQQTYDALGASDNVGPYNLVAVGSSLVDPTNRREYSITLADNAAATAAAAAINGVTGLAAIVSPSTGETHPPVNAVMYWEQTNAVTGAGEWRYETIASHAQDHLTLEQLNDVESGTPTIGNLLRWDGNQWARVADLGSTNIRSETDDVNDAQRAITTDHIRNDAVTRDKIGPAAVFQSQLAVDTVQEVHLAPPTASLRTTERLLQWDPTSGGAGAWEYVNHADILGDNTISDLGDIPAEPTSGQPVFLQWDPGANSGAGAWSYVMAEEAAVPSIFNIGDVQHRQDLTPVTFTRPTDPAAARITAAPVNSVGVESPPDDTADVQFESGADISGISIGDRIGFTNADGTMMEDDGMQGFNVDAITPGASPSITIRDIDGDVIPQLVRDNIDNTKFPFLFTRTGGDPEPVIGGEVLSYNAMSRMWENNTPGEAGLVTQVVAGEGAEAQTLNPDSTTGAVTILQATPDGDGVMSSEDKLKLDHIPEAPETVNGDPISSTNPQIPDGDMEHYALQVTRTGTTGDIPDQYSERWVNISDIITSGGSPLVFDRSVTGDVTIRQIRDTNNVPQNIRETEFQTISGRTYLRFELATFTPTLLATTQSLAWDQSTNLVRGQVTNPLGVTEYLDDMTVTGVTNNSLTTADFNATTFNNTPAAEVNWIGTRTLTTGTVLAADTGANGGTSVATIGFTRNDAQPFTDTTTHTITWGSVSASAPTATLGLRSSIPFYEMVNSLTISQSIRGLSTATNGRIDWNRNSGLTGNLPAEGANATSFTRTYTLSDVLYKDNTQAAANATVTSTAVATRPATVRGTSQDVTLRNNVDSNRPTVGITMPRLQLTGTTLSSDTIDPYNAASNNLAVLTGDFTTGNGMILNGATIDASTTRTLTFTGPNPSVYWIGAPGNTAPTIELESAPGSNVFNAPDANSTRTQTVVFDRTVMMGSNVPAGWTDVTYTFRGVQITATQRARITF